MAEMCKRSVTVHLHPAPSPSFHHHVGNLITTGLSVSDTGLDLVERAFVELNVYMYTCML